MSMCLLWKKLHFTAERLHLALSQIKSVQCPLTKGPSLIEEPYHDTIEDIAEKALVENR